MSVKDFRHAISKFNFRTRFLKTIAQGTRVLELGVGSGLNVAALHELNPSLELYGVDLQDYLPENHHVTFKKLNLDKETLPYEDEFFDSILIVHVMEHLHQPIALAKELSRVLKPGGCIYIESPNWVSMFIPSFGFQRAQHGPFNFFDDPTHVKPWSRHGVYSYLTEFVGLHDVRVGVTRNMLRLILDPMIIVGGLLMRRRRWLVTSVSNVVGWCVYGYGFKPLSTDKRNSE